MAPRGFNISAPWRHRPDRDVSRRIPGQTLRHCHDACIAPDHGAQEQAVRARRRSLRHCAPWGGTRHPAMGRRARTRHGRCWAAWAVPVGPGCTPRIPEGGKPDWRFSGGARNAPRCCCRAGTTRCPIVERRGAMWLAQGWARAGPASAGMCRSRRRAGRKEPVLVRSFLVRKIPARRACSSFRHVAGVTRHVDPAYARLPVMDAAVAIGLAFECVPDPGWLSAVVWAKPCAFASAGAPQVLRGELCAGCALAACLGFSALDPALPVAFLFRRT